jgi:hypothetical protein
MNPFWLYTEIEPALGRSDVFLAVTNYSGEPEPHRDLLHFPEIDEGLVPLLARRLAFWAALEAGLGELYSFGCTYGHLREETVAITNQGTPLLYDTMALRLVRNQPPTVDWTAFRALRSRLA